MKFLAVLAAVVVGCSSWGAETGDVYTNLIDGVKVIHAYKPHKSLEYGIPSTNVDTIIERDGYAVGYSNKYRQPLWTVYRLTDDLVVSVVAKRKNDFRKDPLVEESASPNDYTGTDYDKGHMVPAADMSYSAWTMSESFLMSNMCPQLDYLNRTDWRFLEAWVRKQAIAEEAITVVTGPMFFVSNKPPEYIGLLNKVRVPDAFYKVILDETPPCKIIAYVYFNEAKMTLEDKEEEETKPVDISHVVDESVTASCPVRYVKPVTPELLRHALKLDGPVEVRHWIGADINWIERATGITFFSKFPNIENIKAISTPSMWSD